MTPVEWPISAPSDDAGPNPARAAGGSRLSAARVDFFLDPGLRLTEQERSLMTAMLTDLVETIADEFAAAIPDLEPANDGQGRHLFERLWQSRLLDIPELLALLLRRAEEERISAGIRAGGRPGKPRFLQSLVSDDDPATSAAAMALILARGRRRDRFDGPRIVFDDLPAEAAVSLVNAVAAALRLELATRADSADVDSRLGDAARELLARHDEGNRLEVRAFALVHALDRTSRLDERLIRSALEEGEIAFLLEALARRAGISVDSAWDDFTRGAGRLARFLRLSGISRELAGEIIARVAGLAGSDPETEICAFDGLSDEEVERARDWLRLDPGYRSAIESMATGNGKRSS